MIRDDAHPPLAPLVRDDHYELSGEPLPLPDETTTLDDLVERGDLGPYVQQYGLGFVAARLPKPRGRALFSIGEDLLALEYLLLDAGGVLSPGEEEAIIDAWFAELREERNAKLDDYAALIRDTSARAAARKSEEDRMARLRAGDEGLVRKLKDRLLYFLERTGETRIDTTHFRIRRQNNGGKLALDWKVGEDRYRELPEPMREERVTYVPRQEEIRAALDAALDARADRMEKIRHDVLTDETIQESSAVNVLNDFANDPHAAYAALHPYSRRIIDALYPPTEAEAVLSFVDYRPRGQQVRID